MKKKIREFIMENLVIYEKGVSFKDDDDIFALGFVDSMFALKLVTFVEGEYGVAVQNEDLDRKNFQSVDSIAAFVERKQKRAS